MPGIGEQLRDTRARRRIDITEVEAATKIRAKYLRALENEEWELLPGPAFVTTFLRTYADHLGLDSRALVAEYRARYDRPSAQELTPFGTNLGSRRSRPPRRPRPTPWMLVLGGILLLGGALYALGTRGPDRRAVGEQAALDRAPAATRTPAARRERGGAARSKTVRVQIRPTGPVSVCLVNAGGNPVIDDETLDAGQDSRTFRGRRFRVSFGTAAARMRVDGRSYAVSRDAPVGYELRAGKKPRRLSDSRRPSC